MNTDNQKSIDVKKYRMQTAAVIAAVIIVVVVLFAGFIASGSYNKEGGSRLLFTMTGLMFSAVLFVACCFKNHDKTGMGQNITLASALLFVIFIICGVYDMVDGMPEKKALTVALVAGSNVVSALVHVLFWHYQCASMPDKRTMQTYTRLIYAFFFCYIALQIINIFNHFMFYIDSAGKLFYTPVGWIIEPGIVGIFYLIYLLYILPQHCRLRKKLAVASFAIFPVIGIIISIICSTSGIIIIDMSSTFIFLLLAAYVVFISDYYEYRERMVQQKAELAEIKSELMLSQINPHFAANTLNSIVALCRFDPPEAERAIRLFAGYLRENYVDMAGNQMISFEKELQNLKNYLAIEQIRFPNIVPEYDITCTQFLIPVMTLQPLAENAITHGIHGSGVIRISAEEQQDAYQITVSDNGKGLREQANDGRKHVGITNCRGRLQMLCGGELTIRNSGSGGTECVIVIPKRGNRDESTVY